MDAQNSGRETVTDERTLIMRAREGDAGAFDAVLNRHQDRVLRVIYSILKDPMDTEEVAQDVFLTVFEKIDSFRADSTFTTWIHRIAVNAALMHRRRSRSNTVLSLDDMMPAFDENGHITEAVADWTRQAEDPALRNEARQVIQKAVEELDAKYRIVFLLRDVEGFTTEETAGILDMGVPAVKSRLHRARLYLRRALAGYFDKQLGEQERRQP